jgi:hypothetical protein
VKLNARLAKLEAAALLKMAATAAATQHADEGRARLQANWEIMRSTMSEAHARLVVEAYSAGMQYVTSPDFRLPAARLVRRCLDAISRYDYAHWPDTLIRAEVALAMPPVVAEVHLAHDVLPLHECEQCGYKLPHEYFTTCPLCGGRVGLYAFWQKHKDDPGDRTLRGPAVRR